MFTKLFQSYNEFHVDEIQTNRFQPEEFNKVLDSLTGDVELTNLGDSIEGRPIRQVKLGTGSTRVLLWSQMHGNESTATRAILDILKLNQQPGSLKKDWQHLLDQLTIYIIPIVNPDGTAVFKRRNACDIDLNRDARAFVCPESQILREAMQTIAPDFSFNLHDQRRFYNITGSGKPSTISFLAPAFDPTEAVNDSRLAAMQLIAALRKHLETVIPGQIGLYDDSFAPRAFGDYSQASGSSTILVEAGWEQYDMEKEVVRKLNFALILAGLDEIARGTYQKYQESDYRDIPMNDEKLFDVLLRNVTMVRNGQSIKLDIGLQREEVTLPSTTKYYSKGLVADLGDLQEWYGFDELKADNLMLVEGKVAQLNLSDWQALEEAEQIELIKEGNLFLRDNGLFKVNETSGEIINITTSNEDLPTLEFEQPANFLLINKQGEIKYIILNGFLWPIDEAPPEGLNGLVIS